MDGQWVGAGLVDAGVDPGPGALADETQGVLEGAAGDPGVDRRVEDLRQRADGGRALEGVLERDHVLGGHRYPVEQRRTAAGGALTEAGPVVDDFQPGAVARDEGQLLAALVVHCQGRHPLRVECAGAVELAPVQAVAVAVGAQAGTALAGGTRADLGQGVAETLAGQGGAEQATFLRRRAVHPQHFEGVEMVLRNLPQGTVGGADDRHHLRQGHPRDAGPAVFAGHRDAPQAGAGEQFQFFQRQAPLAVALDAFAGEQGGQLAGRFQGFVVAADAMGSGRGIVARSVCEAHRALLRSMSDAPDGRRSGSSRRPRGLSSAPGRAGYGCGRCASAGRG
ncbi:hypothetical protein PAERUG_E5_London_17_VIM_2_12_12_02151 [Pseudomonas aeruginosa]|nr:hypothetical protein PAERUG_E5_London_17_VIM_2_12_12_02151 [Pseudomonas aeruginosa]CRQ62581.1 hypothetical protein PAERUG_P2_London_28_IMP_1_06_05_06463 [Pseudomonas aeruginosa]